MKSSLSRREMLKSAMAIQAAALVDIKSRKVGPIEAENWEKGTTDWMLKNTRIDPKKKYRCPWIEGYCSHTSIKAGEELSIFISTNPAAPFTLDIYRMGYYGGLGGRHMLRVGPIDGKVQDDPALGERRVR